MFNMHNPEGLESSKGKSPADKLNGESTGFSHGAYNSNYWTGQGFGDRHVRRTNVPSINTDPRHSLSAYAASEQTPGTAYEMNFTPLLPSQLLLGSPFQAGSSPAFNSPAFFNYGRFNQANPSLTQQSQLGSPTRPSLHPLSPPMFHSLPAHEAMRSQEILDSPQLATDGLAALGSSTLSGPATPMSPNVMPASSRTVYLGNIPTETSPEEILSHIRSGQIESVKLLLDKNCAFISFLEPSSAVHFHSDAILKKLSINGHDIKVGWGKPSAVPSSVALAVQQSSASRNVYLGGLPGEITDADIRESVGKFGPIDTIKIVREKAIAFVHFLSISTAMKAVAQLPQEPEWQAPRRVYYGKDRCAYVSKTQQQNAAQYLGIAPGYAHVLNGADRDLISNALAQQSVAAATVATTAGGVTNMGNRTVYLGNIHPETTIEEICNVVRGGLLHHIRYIPDKHISFVTFIDPTSAASFYALSNLQGLMIHNRRLKIGWGKHSGALPPAIALAVSGGASRNVYIGNLDDSWSEERIRQDFSEYGEIELVNALREKSCAFVNFTNIANAIKAIEGIRGREEYKRFKINFGKDRCGNAPRQTAQQQQRLQGHLDRAGSPPVLNGLPGGFVSGSQPSPTHPISSPAPGFSGSRPQQDLSRQHTQQSTVSIPSTVLNTGSSNPLTMYLNQLSLHQEHGLPSWDEPMDTAGHQPMTAQRFAQHTAAQAPQQSFQHGHQHHQSHTLSTSSHSPLYGNAPNPEGSLAGAGLSLPNQIPPRQNSISGAFSGAPSQSGGSITVGGLLAPSNADLGGGGFNASRGAHSRAISLPAFSQESAGREPQAREMLNTNSPGVPMGSHAPQGSFGGFASAFGSGLGTSGISGLSLQADAHTGLPGWVEEEVGAK